MLFYLGAYVLMKVGAFLVVTHLGQQGEKRLEIRDYAGLGSKQPVLAACFSLFLLSLLGLPATGGFLGKFFAFQAALDLRDPRFVWLVVIAAINSVIGAYYYLRVIIVMYFSEPSQGLHAHARSRPRLASRWPSPPWARSTSVFCPAASSPSPSPLPIRSPFASFRKRAPKRRGKTALHGADKQSPRGRRASQPGSGGPANRAWGYLEWVSERRWGGGGF